MILRGLKLENIRSYTTAQLSLPEGSVLLSGDIGCGKSTILLAIDFALFGIQKNLSGASLLRHGKETGSVELEFEVAKKVYTIKRTLKRKGDAVRQTAGHIIADGVKKDLTAQESKSFILELLGYPQQALKKDSALLYRYTVYTPQEQMKQIIEANPDERLDLIRRLFGIDKYKRIAENAEIYAKELRGRARELSGSISDLDEKKKTHEELSKEIGAENKLLKQLNEKVTKSSAIVEEKKKELDLLQKQIETVQEKKQKYASLRAEFEVLKERTAVLKNQVSDIEPKIKEIDDKLSVFSKLFKPEITLHEIDEGISKLEMKERKAISDAAGVETEISSLSEILDKGVCGTCHQDVADKESFKKSIDLKKNELEKLKKEQSHIRVEIESLRKQHHDAQKYDSQMKEKKSLEERKGDLTNLKSQCTREFKEKQEKMKTLADTINSLAREIKGDALLKEFKEKQVAFEEVRASKEELHREESALSQKIKGLENNLSSLDQEIKKKEESKKLMDECTKNDRFLRDFFVKLMSTIERHVMVNVQHEFNSLFQKWFSMLVMSENMSARVDDRFAVIIEQNGFETEYSFLSGGERTAVALAYRLALNRVINDLTENIRTKDLMILDEPTDGFSSDQMSSVRDVLDELDNRQTIIVSHEPKIESFVDQTIRFLKEDGASKVV